MNEEYEEKSRTEKLLREISDNTQSCLDVLKEISSNVGIIAAIVFLAAFLAVIYFLIDLANHFGFLK